MKLITTSWDDGHVLDMRLAALLDKYDLQATFYIPKGNGERKVMVSSDILQLSSRFEIGGHTLDHKRLDVSDRTLIEHQVKGSFKWLQQLLGNDPVSFCFPKGKFNAYAVQSVFDAGYKIARTTELLTIATGNRELIGTTLQVYDHNTLTYIKNLLKRRRWRNLLKWATRNSLYDLEKLTDTYLNEINDNGGCFHLWGHSWEIDEYKLWKKLEAIFNRMAHHKQFQYIQNRQILLMN